MYIQARPINDGVYTSHEATPHCSLKSTNICWRKSQNTSLKKHQRRCNMATFESAIEDQDLEAVLELLNSKPRPSQKELNKALAFAVDPELGLPHAVVPLFEKGAASPKTSSWRLSLERVSSFGRYSSSMDGISTHLNLDRQR